MLRMAAALCGHVLRVDLGVAEKKVPWVAARRIVASVANHMAVVSGAGGDASLGKGVGNTVRAIESAKNLETTISTG